MSAPEFEWVIYDVVSTATVEAATIPQLDEWPRARDKARILLKTAAKL